MTDNNIHRDQAEPNGDDKFSSYGAQSSPQGEPRGGDDQHQSPARRFQPKPETPEEKAARLSYENAWRKIDEAWFARCREEGWYTYHGFFLEVPVRHKEQMDIAEKAARAGTIPDFDELLRIGERIVNDFYATHREGFENAAYERALAALDGRVVSPAPNKGKSKTAKTAKPKRKLMTDDAAMCARIEPMHEEGLSALKITEALNKAGHKISRATVQKFIAVIQARKGRVVNDDNGEDGKE